MALADYEIWLPHIEQRTRDWPREIQAADGLTKRILQMQERAVYAIAGVVPRPTTPEKLAWSILWMRGFLLLQAAMDLRGSASASVADMLFRAAFELLLQVQAIKHPWNKLNELTKSGSNVTVAPQRLEAEWKTVADRLRGFAAWALTNDLVYYRYRDRDWELNAVYASTDPTSLPRNETEAALHTYLFGEPEVVSKAEVKRDRANADVARSAVIARLEDWLADPAFGHWICKDFLPWIQDGKQRDVPSLYTAFGVGRGSVLDMLKDWDAAHLYGLYARASAMVHGSTIEHFTWTSPTRIVPVLVTPDDDAERLCEELADTCNLALLGLWAIRDKCVPS